MNSQKVCTYILSDFAFVHRGFRSLEVEQLWFPHRQGYVTTQTGYRTTPVGCRGGSRHFDGVCGFLGIPKIQNFDLPKIPRIHADPTLLGNPKDLKNRSSKNTKIPRGSKITCKSQRFKRMIVRKYKDSTRIQNYEKWSILFQTYV